MAFVGMDVDAIYDQVNRLRSIANSLQESDSRVTAALSEASAIWSGVDAGSSRARLQVEQQHLRALIDELLTAAAVLERGANEQRMTSW